MTNFECDMLYLNYLMGYRRYRLKWNNGYELWVYTNPFLLEFVRKLE